MSTPKQYWEDFKAGDATVLGPRLVTAEEIKAFALAFDPQPMHTDEAAAAATMMGGLCASGWHTCGLAMRLIADGFLNDSASMGAPGVEEVRFHRPLRPGDSVTVRTEVLETRASRTKPDRGFVRFSAVMVNAADEKLMTWTATLMQRRRPDFDSPSPPSRSPAAPFPNGRAP